MGSSTMEMISLKLLVPSIYSILTQCLVASFSWDSKKHVPCDVSVIYVTCESCSISRSLGVLSEVTRSNCSWGVPLSSFSTTFFTSPNVLTSSPINNVVLHIGVYPPYFGEISVCRYGTGFHRMIEPVLRPSPYATWPPVHHDFHFAACPFHRRLCSFHRCLCSINYDEMGQQTLVMEFRSPSTLKYFIFSLVLQPTNQWGNLVYLAIFLKIFGGFIKVFTKTNLHSLDHLSCLKSKLSSHLPVSTPEPSVSSFASFLRSAFPPILWRCLSISITVLLSCGAVRLGPEDAARFVSTSFRGTDWISTSQHKVTISLLSDHVVKATLTHSSTVLSSLSSSSFEDLSFLFYDVVVYGFNQRGWIIPSNMYKEVS